VLIVWFFQGNLRVPLSHLFLPLRHKLFILKNRNGSTGNTITFDYHCLFNYFEETGAKEEKKTNKRF